MATFAESIANKLVLALQPLKHNGSNRAATTFFNNIRFNGTKWGQIRNGSEFVLLEMGALAGNFSRYKMASSAPH